MAAREDHVTISARDYERIIDELKAGVLRDAELTKDIRRLEVAVAVLQTKTMIAAASVSVIIGIIMLFVEHKVL